MKYDMSKYLPLALLAIFASACSSSDEGIVPDKYSDDVIRFATPTIVMEAPETPTRAALMNSVEENTTFGVLGYCVPYELENDKSDFRGGISDWLTKKALSHADVMYKEPIYYDGEKCVYRNHAADHSLPKRWYTLNETNGEPVGRFLYTFIAYHPFEQANGGGFDVTPTNKDTRGIPKLTYTMPYAAGGALTDRLDIDAAKDVMMAMEFDRTASQGAVPFKFKHVLSGLNLQINNYNLQKEVIIHDLSISGHFYRKAEIDFAPADPTMSVTDDMYSGTFHFLEGANETIPADSYKVIGETENNARGTAILLLPKFDPKTLGDGTSSLPYLGTEKTITITYSYPGEAPLTKEIKNFSLGRKPVQGTCYTLNLNFIGSELLLMFTADSIEYWEAGSDNQIIIN